MQYRKFSVRVPGAGTASSLTLYGQDLEEPIRKGRLSPALLVCPGGAYAYTSPREAEPVALVFLARGFNVYVLRYHCAPEARWPVPQLEAAEAIRMIRSQADETMTDPTRVFICGFSAGGHLAASVGILWKRAGWAAALKASDEEIRPTGMVLCYPVVTAGEKAHRGSIENLLGPEREDVSPLSVSLEKQVGTDCVPAFIWHTRTDPSVPVENSLYLAAALAENGVPFEMHVFPRGGHGLSLANALTDAGDGGMIAADCAVWPQMAADWMLGEKWRL